MYFNIVKLFCGILLLNCVIAERISDLKCSEALSLNTDSRSLYPYAMELIFYIEPDKVGPHCFGTLLSESFVLTNAGCINATEKFLYSDLRKFKLPDEQYSNNQVFTIKRSIVHELYDGVYFDVGLIELNEVISFQGPESIFRPACLWSNPYRLPPSNAQSLFSYRRDEDYRVIVKPATLLLTCYSNYMKYPELFTDGGFPSNIICANSTGKPVDGSPIVDKMNPHVIIGIYLSLRWVGHWEGDFYATKISDVIDWIELHVWPEARDVNPGKNECGQRKIILESRVTFGHPTYHGEFPWNVALYQIKDRDNHKYICGGTIINARFILTAAHCLSYEHGILPANRLLVVAGTYVLNESPIDARYYGVGLVLVHERFNQEYLEHDIALLKLNSIVEFSNYIQPICLGNTSTFSNMEVGIVAGWGLNEYRQASNYLLKATFPIHDNFYCRASNRNFFPQFLNENNFCAGYQNGTNACSGDSGSGIIYNNSSQWYIRGLVSFGQCIPNSFDCDITELAVFTDVSKYFNWIMNKLGNRSLLNN